MSAFVTAIHSILRSLRSISSHLVHIIYLLRLQLMILLLSMILMNPIVQSITYQNCTVIRVRLSIILLYRILYHITSSQIDETLFAINTIT